MTGFTKQSFAVLGALAENNNRDWYEANKAEIKRAARVPFAGMLEVTTALLAGSRYPLIGGEKTMFRQHRDVRFSKDKTPYKPTVSGLLTPDGTKAEMGGVVYAQIDPAGGMMAAGFYQLATAELNKVRDRMIADAGTFGDLVEALQDKGYPLSRDNSLKTMPRGMKQHEDHPLADLLKLKGYTVSKPQPQDVWISGDIVEELVHLAEAMGPLNAWIRAALTYGD
ncbi:DUF2461 domain-containing protein [Sulfitobacter albidus]|uniref:DUF2461 domain-containing protein n=1 Tax=Sulfitobacter albidus TaxID=2829501 RepID=A0A975JC77_9RHOB|nr:DUF2461 domain-containing protein [Sulfitobacter albidus]QUJ75672.1 DUF2461 domain-containing protein [Sulfitobacter albidus]